MGLERRAQGRADSQEEGKHTLGHLPVNTEASHQNPSAAARAELRAPPCLKGSPAGPGTGVQLVC